MRHSTIIRTLLTGFCLAAIFFAFGQMPSVAYGSSQSINYVPLAPIDAPGSELKSTGDAAVTKCQAPTCFPRYLRTLYNVGIALAGLFAVVSIVRGGFELMFTDSILKRSEGKGIILRALGGLVIVYSSYILMNAINPALGRDLDLALQFPRVDKTPEPTPLTIVSSAHDYAAQQTIQASLEAQASHRTREELRAEGNALAAEKRAIDTQIIPGLRGQLSGLDPNSADYDEKKDEIEKAIEEALKRSNELEGQIAANAKEFAAIDAAREADVKKAEFRNIASLAWSGISNYDCYDKLGEIRSIFSARGSEETRTECHDRIVQEARANLTELQARFIAAQQALAKIKELSEEESKKRASELQSFYNKQDNCLKTALSCLGPSISSTQGGIQGSTARTQSQIAECYTTQVGPLSCSQ